MQASNNNNNQSGWSNDNSYYNPENGYTGWNNANGYLQNDYTGTGWNNAENYQQNDYMNTAWNNTGNYTTNNVINSTIGSNYNQSGYNSYNGRYNQNGYNYNNNYNGAGNYNSAPDRYTDNNQKKFFGGKFQYPIPYTANTVCVEPKTSKLVTKLVIALMLTMPIGILLVILSYVLAVVFLTDVFINIAMALISVAFVGILVSLVVILTLGPVLEAISKKRHCKLKLKGVIRDVRYSKTSKGSRRFIPLYSYVYKGKQYYFEGAESMFEKFEIGSEVELYINEADPTQQYVPDEQKSIAVYHLVMIGMILLAFLIAGISAYCDFH